MAAETPMPGRGGCFRQSAVTILRDRATRLRLRAEGYEALADAIEGLQSVSRGSRSAALLRIGAPAEEAIWELITRERA